MGKKNNCVIDTGGGIILRKNNVKNLKRNGLMILLKADVETIINRIKNGRERPSLTGRSFTEEVEEVLKNRSKKYEEAADLVIDTSELTVNKVVDRVISFIKQRTV